MEPLPVKTPGAIVSILQCKCPDCRKGRMFLTRNPYNLSKTLAMNERCPECGLNFEPEVGFYFGTGYVSYGLSVAFIVTSFVFSWIVFGFSLRDNSLFYWLGATIALLLLIQPMLMRLSRAIWLAIFTKKRPAHKLA